MGGFSIWHWIIVLIVVLLLFGAGKIPRLMGDVAKGVKAFKKGLQDDDAPAESERRLEEPRPAADAQPAATPRKDEAPRG
ncbi:twin-arginine translocase TatA/TatE family subunit [Pararhodospirillum oryzae]|uniref:Sec-independent protein translocase protein TatA n=1 Tax=Pararhodospirillum oryzae TaxID=478448 RepID=A0A512HBF5_9PROT|nr:twin-arginine translocase TatA/TatE family subunit [Pararhodospirillum oryzae]GEO82784.1 Sec-independent protein translocase protein TatA [Pararhodospirillum oryzae]